MPTLSELDTAMMQPGLSVPAIRHLQGGAIRRNSEGRPLRVIGRDAVVYELEASDGRIWALRCLYRPSRQRRHILAERYRSLAGDETLSPLRGPSGVLPQMLLWIDDGVMLSGPDFHGVTAPVIAMERVPGRTLLRAVDRLCTEEQRETLALLADTWLATVATLTDANFSHGDLAADNLIVRPNGSFALVDFDTAVWPAEQAAVPSGGGTPGYVHPRGEAGDLFRRDRFPALLIWASLRILAKHPEIRKRWGDHPDQIGGALLWSADDLQRPGRSPVFAALDDLRDPVLAPLIEVVRRAIRFPADETPTLSEIADRLDALGLPRLAAASPRRRASPPPFAVVASPPAPATQPRRAEAPASAPPADAFPVSAPATGLRTPKREAPPESDRSRAARDLKQALDARDLYQVLRLWDAHRAEPGVAVYATAVHFLAEREATAAIDRAIRRGADDELIAAAAAAERVGIAVSAEARRALRAAQGRIAARRALRVAVEDGDLDALAKLAASGRLECLGRLAPEEARAVAQARAWPALSRAISADSDAAILAAADPNLWQGDDGFPVAVRARLSLARERQQWLATVRGALRRRDGASLRTLLNASPEAVEQQLSEVESRRILRFSTHELAVRRLEQALRDGPDSAVVAALAEAEASGARFSDVLDWAAVQGVVDRISLSQALRAAAAADPPDTARLARLLPAARAALQEHAGPQDPDWTALERAVLQAAHAARLREALGSGNDAQIAAAALPDPFAARSLLSSAERAQVDATLRRFHRRGGAA
ncbi:MAG: hypothetical protein U0031_19380 [Thermomicrobiales bacterium]